MRVMWKNRNRNCHALAETLLWRAWQTGLAWLCLALSDLTWAAGEPPAVELAPAIAAHAVPVPLGPAGPRLLLGDRVERRECRYGPDPAELLDLYLPRDAATPRPVVVFIHGGGWSAGHRRQAGAFTDFPQVLAGVAVRGYAVASIDYRLSGVAAFPAQLEDLERALAWLDAQAPLLGLDTSRLALWGFSAGAHLAALLAAQRPVVLIGWCGIYDPAALLDSQGESTLGGALRLLLACPQGTCPPRRLQEAGPLQQLRRPPRATLLLHGEEDRLVPAEQARTLAAALRARGGPVELKVWTGVGHSLVGPDLATTQAVNRAALSATLAFLAARLPAATPPPRPTGQ